MDLIDVSMHMLRKRGGHEILHLTTLQQTEQKLWPYYNNFDQSLSAACQPLSRTAIYYLDVKYPAHTYAIIKTLKIITLSNDPEEKPKGKTAN